MAQTTGPYQERTIIVCVCQRCGYEWVPRSDTRPTKCPKCFEVEWDTPQPEEKVSKRPVNVNIHQMQTPQIKPIPSSFRK